MGSPSSAMLAQVDAYVASVDSRELASLGSKGMHGRLTELGVTKIGERMRIVNALHHRLATMPSSSSAPPIVSSTLPPPAPPPPAPAAPVKASEPACSFYPSWLVAGELPRLQWNDPALERFLRCAEPVVITGGCPLTRAFIGRWTHRYLADHFGDVEQPNSHFTPRHSSRFSRFYGKGLGEGGVTRQSFASFVEQSAANEFAHKQANAQPARPKCEAAEPTEAVPPWRFYMQASLLWTTGKGCEARGGGELPVPARAHATQRVTHAAVDLPLVEDIRNGFDWGWLDDAMRMAGTEVMLPPLACQ